MTDASEKNIGQLVMDLGSKNATERLKWRGMLTRIGVPAVPALLTALDDPQQHVRWESAKALAEIADPSAADKLVAALGDKDSDVRWVVGTALIALRRNGLQPLLTALTKSDLPDGLSEGAHHVLHELVKHEDLTSLLKPVLQAFDAPEPDVAVPVAAAEAMKDNAM